MTCIIENGQGFKLLLSVPHYTRENSENIDYKIVKICYLGGFAGGSDLLLSTSENVAFFKVVIIRGGFGGP